MRTESVGKLRVDHSGHPHWNTKLMLQRTSAKFSAFWHQRLCMLDYVVMMAVGQQRMSRTSHCKSCRTSHGQSKFLLSCMILIPSNSSEFWERPLIASKFHVLHVFCSSLLPFCEFWDILSICSQKKPPARLWTKFIFTNNSSINKGVEVNPPIDQILELGVAPRLLELSQQMATPQLQFETLYLEKRCEKRCVRVFWMGFFV